MAEQLLSGIKVLDLSWYITGPYCTKLLAGYGADVLKIERPPGGDPARTIGPFLNDDPHPEKSLLFSNLNLNKRSVTLNLKTETGKRIFKDLVKDVDILVESYSPGVMARLGLDYETLKAINPNLVMVSISNFGQTGPYRDFKTSELVLAGIGADQYSNGLDGREPLKLGGNVHLYQAGNVAAGAVLAAYWCREIHGISQYVDCSMQEMWAADTNYKTINMIAWAYSGRATGGRRDARLAVTDISPAGVYPTKDGFVNISVGIAMWQRFLRLVKSPELEALKFPADVANLDNKPLVDAVWYGWCAERTKLEAMLASQAEKVFCTAITTPMDVLTDPQFQHVGFWTEVEHPVTGKQTYPGAPCRFPDAPWAVRMPPPLLGQHNADVYCNQLGYAKEDLVRLREAGVI